MSSRGDDFNSSLGTRKLAASSPSAADYVLSSAGFATLPACDRCRGWATNVWPSLFFFGASRQALFQCLHNIDYGSLRPFRRCGSRLSFQFGLDQGIKALLKYAPVFFCHHFGALDKTIARRTEKWPPESRMTLVVKLMERDSPWPRGGI